MSLCRSDTAAAAALADPTSSLCRSRRTSQCEPGAPARGAARPVGAARERRAARGEEGAASPRRCCCCRAAEPQAPRQQLTPWSVSLGWPRHGVSPLPHLVALVACAQLCRAAPSSSLARSVRLVYARPRRRRLAAAQASLLAPTALAQHRSRPRSPAWPSSRACVRASTPPRQRR
jgi:hypothetical protein